MKDDNRGAMTIYAYTKDEREEAEQVEREATIFRLMEIENLLFYLNQIDHWSGDDQREYIRLTAEREKLRRGE